MSSSSTSSNASTGMTIDIRPLIEDVSQVMTKHITNILTGVIGDYTVYKETHNTIMSLPCVRKLQDRISELESMCNSTGTSGEYGGVVSGCEGNAAASSSSHTREEEVAQLQSAIVDLNRYIQALEAKVDMKSVAASAATTAATVTATDEEAIKLEIHEEDAVAGEEDDEPANNEPTTTTCQLNKIVSIPEDEADANDEEAEEEDAEEEDAEEAEAAEEEEAEAEEAAEEDAEVEEAEAADSEEEAEAEAADAEEEAEEEADAEEEAEEEAEKEEEAEEADGEAEEEAEADAEEEEADEEEAAEEEEAAAAADDEIEVSEVKIKGKTYFTTDHQNGIIYACVDDDVGDEVGVFKNGIAVFNKGKK